MRAVSAADCDVVRSTGAAGGRQTEVGGGSLVELGAVGRARESLQARGRLRVQMNGVWRSGGSGSSTWQGHRGRKERKGEKRGAGRTERWRRAASLARVGHLSASPSTSQPNSKVHPPSPHSPSAPAQVRILRCAPTRLIQNTKTWPPPCWLAHHPTHFHQHISPA